MKQSDENIFYWIQSYFDWLKIHFYIKRIFSLEHFSNHTQEACDQDPTYFIEQTKKSA